MGINGLHKLLRDKGVMRPSHLRKYRGRRIAVDAHGWLFRGAYSCGEALARGEKPWLAHNHDPPYITYCMNLVRMMLDLGVVPVVVLDGDRLPAKALTLDKRREARTTNTNRAHDAAQEGDQQAAARFMQRSYSVTAEMAAELVVELKRLNVEFLVAPYEADAQMAWLADVPEVRGGVAAVITEDSDMLCYGAVRAVLFKVDRAGACLEVQRDHLFGISRECVDLTDAMDQSRQMADGPAAACTSRPGICQLGLGLGVADEPPALWAPDDEEERPCPPFANWTQEMFIGMCVFAGCDFLPVEATIKGFGIMSAYTMIKKYRNLERVLYLLQRDKKKKVPEGFASSFWKAIQTFKYARVYDTNTKSMRTLRTLPEELAGDDVDTRFLGPLLEPTVAQGVAEGRINPITRMAVVPAARPANRRQAQWEHASPAAASKPSSSSHRPSTSFFGRLRPNEAESQQQWSVPLPNRSDLTSLVSQMGYHASAPATAATAATPPAASPPCPSKSPSASASASASASRPCMSPCSGNEDFDADDEIFMNWTDSMDDPQHGSLSQGRGPPLQHESQSGGARIIVDGADDDVQPSAPEVPMDLDSDACARESGRSTDSPIQAWSSGHASRRLSTEADGVSYAPTHRERDEEAVVQQAAAANPFFKIKSSSSDRPRASRITEVFTRSLGGARDTASAVEPSSVQCEATTRGVKEQAPSLQQQNLARRKLPGSGVVARAQATIASFFGGSSSSVKRVSPPPPASRSSKGRPKAARR